jgi:hypothetical protein
MIIFFLIIQRDTPPSHNRWRSIGSTFSRRVKENNAGYRSVCHSCTHPPALSRQSPLREHERDQHQFSYRDHLSEFGAATRVWKRDATAGVSKANPSKYLIKNTYIYIGQIDRRAAFGRERLTLCVARTLFLIYHTQT